MIRWLHRIIPLRFTSTYSVTYRAGQVEHTEGKRSTWWQWRDHVYLHKEVEL